MEAIKVINAVRKLAADHPDAVYSRTEDDCLYTEGACGPGRGCLIGQGILAVDTSMRDELVLLDKSGGQGAGTALRELGINHSPDDRNWLCSAQDSQDMGDPWGEAVAKADEAVRGVNP